MTLRLRPLTIALSAAALLASAAAPAGDPPKPQQQTTDPVSAKEYFRRAVKAYEAGKTQEAYDNYRAAWELQKSYDIAGNLANVEAELKRYREAAEHARWALANFPPVGSDKQRKILEDLLSEAKRHVGTLTIRVSVNPAEVTLDGKSLGQTPIAESLFVDAGNHTLVVTAPGYQPISQPLRIEKGSSETLSLTLAAVGPTPTASGSAPPPPPTVTPSKVSPVVIAGASAAAAFAAVGAAFTILSFVKADDAAAKASGIKNAEGEGAPCHKRPASAACEDLQSLLGQRDTFANVALWTFVGAGTLGAATIVYALAGPKPAPSSTGRVTRNKRPAPTEAHFEAVPIISPMGGALLMRGAF